MVFGIVQDSARALPGLPAGLTEMAEEKSDDGVTRGRGEALRCTTRVLCTGWMEIVQRSWQWSDRSGFSSGVECNRWLIQESLEHAFPRSYMRSCCVRFDGGVRS